MSLALGGACFVESGPGTSTEKVYTNIDEGGMTPFIFDGLFHNAQLESYLKNYYSIAQTPSVFFGRSDLYPKRREGLHHIMDGRVLFNTSDGPFVLGSKDGSEWACPENVDRLVKQQG